MLWICQGCTAAFSVGAPKCPHCGGTVFREQGDEDGPVRSTVTGEPVEAKAAAKPAGGKVASSAGKAGDDV